MTQRTTKRGLSAGVDSSSSAASPSKVSITPVANRCKNTILKHWSITSLDEVVPSLNPPMWNEYILKKMSTLAKHETLEAGRSIIHDQISRRRREDMAVGKVKTMVYDYLIKRDLDEIISAKSYKAARNKTPTSTASGSRESTIDTPPQHASDEADINGDTIVVSLDSEASSSSGESGLTQGQRETPVPEPVIPKHLQMPEKSKPSPKHAVKPSAPAPASPQPSSPSTSTPKPKGRATPVHRTTASVVPSPSPRNGPKASTQPAPSLLASPSHVAPSQRVTSSQPVTDRLSALQHADPYDFALAEAQRQRVNGLGPGAASPRTKETPPSNRKAKKHTTQTSVKSGAKKNILQVVNDLGNPPRVSTPPGATSDERPVARQQTATPTPTRSSRAALVTKSPQGVLNSPMAIRTSIPPRQPVGVVSQGMQETNGDAHSPPQQSSPAVKRGVTIASTPASAQPAQASQGTLTPSNTAVTHSASTQAMKSVPSTNAHQPRPESTPLKGSLYQWGSDSTQRAPALTYTPAPAHAAINTPPTRAITTNETQSQTKPKQPSSVSSALKATPQTINGTPPSTAKGSAKVQNGVSTASITATDKRLDIRKISNRDQSPAATPTRLQSSFVRHNTAETISSTSTTSQSPPPVAYSRAPQQAAVKPTTPRQPASQKRGPRQPIKQPTPKQPIPNQATPEKAALQPGPNLVTPRQPINQMTVRVDAISRAEAERERNAKEQRQEAVVRQQAASSPPVPPQVASRGSPPLVSQTALQQAAVQQVSFSPATLQQSVTRTQQQQAVSPSKTTRQPASQQAVIQTSSAQRPASRQHAEHQAPTQSTSPQPAVQQPATQPAPSQHPTPRQQPHAASRSSAADSLKRRHSDIETRVRHQLSIAEKDECIVNANLSKALLEIEYEARRITEARESLDRLAGDESKAARCRELSGKLAGLMDDYSDCLSPVLLLGNGRAVEADEDMGGGSPGTDLRAWAVWAHHAFKRMMTILEMERGEGNKADLEEDLAEAERALKVAQEAERKYLADLASIKMILTELRAEEEAGSRKRVRAS